MPRRERAGLDDGEVLEGAEGLVALVVDSGADIVLNALVGSAGLGPTVATLGEGIDLALANKESLVVGGELVMQLAEATGAQVDPGRLRALGAAPAHRRRSAGNGRAARPDRERGPVPRALARRARGRDRGAGARAPDMGHGRQDHDRLRHAHEQGAGADRGPPPVRRALRAHRRGRAPAVDRPQPDHAQRRRRRSRTSAIPTCACRSPTRCITPSASTFPVAAAGPRRGRRASTFEQVDTDAFPACAWPARPPSRAAPRPACSTPPTRSPCTRSSAAACRFSASQRSSRRRWTGWGPADQGIRDALRGRPRGPRDRRGASRRARSRLTGVDGLNSVAATGGQSTT